MKVYIVISHWGDFDNHTKYIECVCSSREKAEGCAKDVDRRECLNDMEKSTFYYLNEIIQNVELDDQCLTDNEFDTIFKNKSGYDIDYYRDLESKMYSDYKCCAIIEKEVLE